MVPETKKSANDYKFVFNTYIILTHTHISIHYVIFINYFSISSKLARVRQHKYYITCDVRFNSHTTGHRILPGYTPQVVVAEHGIFIRRSYYTFPSPPLTRSSAPDHRSRVMEQARGRP